MKSRSALAVFALGLGAACGQPRTNLLFPTELVDGSFTRMILLLQDDETPSSPIQRAEFLELPSSTTRRFEVTSPERARVRVLAYEVAPPELTLELGPLPRASEQEGLPLPTPALGFLSPPLLASDPPPWERWELSDTAVLPWRLPAPPKDDTCPRAATSAWRVAGLELVQPRGLLARGPNELVVAGQWSEPDGETARASLLVRVSELDTSARLEALVPAEPLDSYRSVIALDGAWILASSFLGRLTRVNLDTREVQSRVVLPARHRWELSRGEDGSVLAFDAQEGTLEGSRGWAQWVDVESLEVTPLDAPEPMTHVEVVTRQVLYAAGDRRLYRLADGAWALEHEPAQAVTELLHGGGRTLAVLGRGVVLERAGDGRWTELALGPGAFELRTGVAFPNGRVVLGGRGGLLMQHYEGEWCNLPRALSRAVRAVAVLDDSTGFAITYSERAGEQVGVTRASFSF